MADKSIVLLKNERHVLPLSPAVRSIVLIGGHADKGVLTGGGSAQVNPPGGNAVHSACARPRPDVLPARGMAARRAAAAFKARFGDSKVSYVSGDDPAAAAAAAKSADVAIVFGYQWESEGMDLKTLALSDEQNKLIEAVAAANPKTVVVLETGSPALSCPGSTKSPASSRLGIPASAARKLWPQSSPAT